MEGGSGWSARQIGEKDKAEQKRHSKVIGWLRANGANLSPIPATSNAIHRLDFSRSNPPHFLPHVAGRPRPEGELVIKLQVLPAAIEKLVRKIFR